MNACIYACMCIYVCAVTLWWLKLLGCAASESEPTTRKTHWAGKPPASAMRAEFILTAGLGCNQYNALGCWVCLEGYVINGYQGSPGGYLRFRVWEWRSKCR